MRREFYPLIPFLRSQFNKVALIKDFALCDGKQYTLDMVKQLVATFDGDPGSVQNDNSYVFLGKYSPMSNFYKCDFKLEGHTYESSEQAYQHKKAQYAAK